VTRQILGAVNKVQWGIQSGVQNMPIYEIHVPCFFLYSAFLSGSKTARREILNLGKGDSVFEAFQ